MKGASRAPLPWQALLAAAFVLAGLAFAVWDLSLLHPGFAAWDEVNVVDYHQRVLEGWQRSVYFSGGLVAFALQRLSLLVFGKHLFALHVPALAALAAESALLWSLLRPRFGEDGAAAAVAINATAAFSLLLARSLLSFSLLPVEFLFCLWTLPRLDRGPAALGLGLLMALLLADYEAWIGAVPLLLLAASGEASLDRRRKTQLWLGLLLGAAALAWLSRWHLAEYLQRRAGANSGAGAAGRLLRDFGANALTYFSGGPRRALWLEGHAAFPALLWPLALWGMLRAPWRWTAMALIGLLPLAAHNSIVESNRAVLSWAPWMLLCGAGWSALSARLLPRWRPALLTVLALSAMGLGFWGHVDSQDRRAGWSYGYSWRLLSAADFLRQREPTGVRLLSDLSWRSGGEARFLLPPPGPDAAVWALLSEDQAGDPPAANAGEWVKVAVDPKAPASYLLKPAPALRPLLESRDARMRALWMRYPNSGQAQLACLEDELKATRDQDPGYSSLVLQALIRCAQEYQEPLSSLRGYLRQDLVIGANLAQLAALCYLPDQPLQARAWAQEALRRDPKRLGAKLLLEQIDAALPKAPAQAPNPSKRK